jgi:hypothetical protein
MMACPNISRLPEFQPMIQLEDQPPSTAFTTPGTLERNGRPLPNGKS